MKTFEKIQLSFKCASPMWCALAMALGATVFNSCTSNSTTRETGIEKRAETHTVVAMPINYKTEQDTTVAAFVDTKPEYPGADAAFNQYMNKHVKFSGARQGRTFAQFVIEKDGSLSDIKIVRSVGKDIDDQVIPALKACKKWQPARQNGRPVRTRYVMPINGTFIG